MNDVHSADTRAAAGSPAVHLALPLLAAGAAYPRRPAANASSGDKPPIVTTIGPKRSTASKIFYREAGPSDAPVVLLLHGFPTSSHMFRNLIPELADRYHVIAPDYPGYGQSDMPDRAKFSTPSTALQSSSTGC